MGKKKSKKRSGSRTKGKARPSGATARMPRKEYEGELERLQVETVRLQEWVKDNGAKILLIFEGRDAAGKGGVIKRITERVSPRVFRVVALPTPTDREKSQWYPQRYVAHLPSAGEVAIFDRSWYNRAGVERVMGFCTEDQYQDFLRLCAPFEETLVDSGIQVIKYWLTVPHDEQRRRFEARIDDPRKQWKLSPMDLESPRRWFEYSRARDAMFDATDTERVPWHIVDSSDKRRARLNCISHLLATVPYKPVPWEAPKLPKRSRKGAYDDVAALEGRNFVPEVF